MAADIQYDNGGFEPTRREKSGGGGLVGFLIKSGFAKDEKQANNVLLVILVVAIVVGVGAWFVL